MTFAFIGSVTSCTIGGRQRTFNVFGEKFEATQDEVASCIAVRGGIPAIPEEDFDRIGHSDRIALAVALNKFRGID